MISLAFVWVLVWIPSSNPAPIKLWAFTSREACEARRATLPDGMVSSCSKVPVE